MGEPRRASRRRVRPLLFVDAEAAGDVGRVTACEQHQQSGRPDTPRYCIHMGASIQTMPMPHLLRAEGRRAPRSQRDARVGRGPSASAKGNRTTAFAGAKRASGERAPRCLVVVRTRRLPRRSLDACSSPKAEVCLAPEYSFSGSASLIAAKVSSAPRMTATDSKPSRNGGGTAFTRPAARAAIQADKSS